MKTLSVTRFTNALKCFDYKRQDDIGLSKGRSTHELLEKFFTMKANDEEKEEALQILTKFNDKMFLNPFDKIFVEYELFSNEINGFKLHGFADLIQIRGDRAVIIDWKGSFRPYDPDTLQSIFYSFMVMDMFPEVNDVVFTLAFTRYGVHRSIGYGRSEYERLKQMIEGYIEQYIEITEEKKLLPGDHCATCNKRWQCNLNSYVNLIKNVKELELDKLVILYRALKKSMNDVKELIEDKLKSEDLTEEDLKRAGVKTTTSTKDTIQNSKAVIAYLKEMGIEEIPVKVSVTDVKKIVDVGPMIERGLIKRSTTVKITY